MLQSRPLLCFYKYVIPRTQHKPIGIKIKAAVTPQQVPFRRRYNFKKADWEGYAKSTDDGIQNLPPTPGNYERFVSLVKKASCRNITRGCRTSYVCGLTDETKSSTSSTKNVLRATLLTLKLQKLATNCPKL